MAELLTFKRFTDPDLARDIAEMLGRHGIEYTLDKAPMVYSPTVVNQTEMLVEYELKIFGADFNKAAQLLAKHERDTLDAVEPDHYLFGFTDDELMDIINKRDEWSAFDYELAKKILNDRGKPVDEAAEKRISEKRLAELKKPETSQHSYVYLGYVFAICGGVLGFFIGWHLMTSKKTLPNGESVYSFTEPARKEGKTIFALSVLGLAVGLYLRFMYGR